MTTDITDILQRKFRNCGRANLDSAALMKVAVERGEGRLIIEGVLAVETGRHMGRSPKDKFIVRDALTKGAVWWENNGGMDVAAFNTLIANVMAYAEGKELFVQDLLAGPDPAYQINVKVVTEYAWHSLFIRNLLIRPKPGGRTEKRTGWIAFSGRS